MNMTLLARARTNRLSALGLLPPGRPDNIYHLDEKRRELELHGVTIQFTTTRRPPKAATVPAARARLFDVA